MKNKLILLVSILLPLVSSCGNNPTIEPTVIPSEPSVEQTEELILEVNYDEFITHKYDDILNDVWWPDTFEPTLSKWDTLGFNVFEQYDVSILSFEKATLKNVWLCGYVDSRIVNELDSATGFYPPRFMYDQFMGVNDLYAKYCQLLNSKEKEKSPIIWYEFDRDVSVPETIGDKKIIMKTNIFEIPINNLNGDYISSFDYVLEGSLNVLDDQLYYPKNGNLITKMSYMNCRSSFIKEDYVSIKIIDGIKYVKFSYYRITLNKQLFGKNILEEVEYFIENENFYYINLSDLSNFIEENKK